MTDETPKDVPNVIMLPPVLVLLHIIAGITLNWIFWTHFGRGWGWLGLLLLAACVVIIAWSKKTVSKSRHARPAEPARHRHRHLRPVPVFAQPDLSQLPDRLRGAVVPRRCADDAAPDRAALVYPRPQGHRAGRRIPHRQIRQHLYGL